MMISTWFSNWDTFFKQSGEVWTAPKGINSIKKYHVKVFQTEKNISDWPENCCACLKIVSPMENKMLFNNFCLNFMWMSHICKQWFLWMLSYRQYDKIEKPYVCYSCNILNPDSNLDESKDVGFLFNSNPFSRMT